MGTGGIPANLMETVDEHLRGLEGMTRKRLGDPHDTPLVSVRTGAAASMPGMTDTVLNLGLNGIAWWGGLRGAAGTNVPPEPTAP